MATATTKTPRRAAAKPAAATVPATPAAPVAAPEAAAADAAPATKDATMNDTVKAIADKAQDQAKATFAQASEQAKSAVEKGKKATEEFVAFSKGNVDAVIESTRIYAKGLETLASDTAAYTKKSFDDTSAALKSLAQASSPTEFFKLHSDYVRSSFDALVAETSRTTEASLKLVGEAAAPIQNRLALAADKIKVAA